MRTALDAKRPEVAARACDGDDTNDTPEAQSLTRSRRVRGAGGMVCGTPETMGTMKKSAKGKVLDDGGRHTMPLPSRSAAILHGFRRRNPLTAGTERSGVKGPGCGALMGGRGRLGGRRWSNETEGL
jgi:hypothetical protein